MPRLPVFVAAALVAAGCGGGADTLDAGDTGEEIANSVEKQSRVTGVEVSCPDGVKTAKGESFDCDLTADRGVTARVEVVQQDDDGNFRFRVTGARE